MSRLLIALFSFFFLQSIVFADPVYPPQGDMRSYTKADFFQHPKSQKTYTETWYYEFEFDSGHRLMVNYIKTNIGVFKGVCGVQVFFMKEGMKSLSIGRELPLDRFVEDKENMKINWSEKNWIIGMPPQKHEIHFDIPKGIGIKADLRFGRMVPGFVSGDGIFRFGSDKSEQMAVMVPIPRARVVGTITVGKQTFKAKGWAYGEHSYQTMLGSSFLNRRIQSRLHTNDNTVSIAYFKTNAKYGNYEGGWSFVADNKSVLEHLGAVSMTKTEPKSRGPFQIASNFVVTNQTGKIVKLDAKWKERQLLQKFSMTQDMSKMMKMVVKSIVGDPVFFRFTNEFEATATINGTPKKIAGTGTHEILATE